MLGLFAYCLVQEEWIEIGGNQLLARQASMHVLGFGSTITMIANNYCSDEEQNSEPSDKRQWGHTTNQPIWTTICCPSPRP